MPIKVLWTPPAIVLPTFAELVSIAIKTHSEEIIANIVAHNTLLRSLKEKHIIRPFIGGYNV